ncbi:MAG: TMEM175 family protein [Pyrinomonadaceae bacterium]
MNFFTKSRVEAFSDGVFAIIITLLVLEIKVPHIETPGSINELATALWHLAPKFIAWVISFPIIGVIWVNHHRIFESLKQIDHNLFWLNANLLLWTSFIPFPTALLGDYPDNKLAVSFFGVANAMMGIAFLLIRLYMWKRPENTNGFSREYLWKGVRNVLMFGPTLYLLGAASAWLHPLIAFAVYLFIPIYFIFPKATALEKTGE